MGWLYTFHVDHRRDVLRAAAGCSKVWKRRPEKLDRRWLKDGCVGQQAMMSNELITKRSGDACFSVSSSLAYLTGCRKHHRLDTGSLHTGKNLGVSAKTFMNDVIILAVVDLIFV